MSDSSILYLKNHKTFSIVNIFLLKKGQLMLDLPVPGLDLRLDEDIENQSSFNEGREVLFKDVIKGLGDVAHSSQPGCGSVTRKELVGKN